MSNFDKVKDEFNKSFGVTNNLTPQLNIFDENPSLVNYRLDLIKEEVEDEENTTKWLETQ